MIFPALFSRAVIGRDEELGVLHDARGPAVHDEAMDLRTGELALIVPLIAALLLLSAWPAGISHHSFAGDRPLNDVFLQFR